MARRQVRTNRQRHSVPLSILSEKTLAQKWPHGTERSINKMAEKWPMAQRTLSSRKRPAELIFYPSTFEIYRKILEIRLSNSKKYP